MSILFRDEITPESPVGGKAAALARLVTAGFEVPPFFVALPGTSDDLLLKAFDRLFSPDERVACRSSARGEDSAEHSFAGQFETYLNVPRDELPSRAAAVWASGASERARSYGSERGVEVAAPAALVQRMVTPAFAGVAFSVDPVAGRKGVAVVSAVRGLGEALVSGEADGESLEIDREGAVLSRRGDASVALPDALAARVAALAREAEAFFGAPQDIEWAADEAGALYLLQSRPVTAMAPPSGPACDPDPGAPLLIWDNSNIAESYSGVTTPLTYSFARRAYENVYREFCRLLWVPPARVTAGEPVFRAMIGLVQGRIYYNLCSWYRVLAMLPGFRLNRGFMEQMMGVREPMPPELVAAIEREGSTGPLRDAWHLARTLAGLVARACGLHRSIRRFHARLEAALADAPGEIETLAAHELVAHYRELEAQLLRRWDAPLMNDFFAMIACGVLRKWSAAWLGDESLANAGLRDIGEIVSLEPARRIRAMAERAARGESIEEDLAGYVAKFGDRCVEELKLESPTLADDPAPLRRSIEALAERLRGADVESEGEGEGEGEGEDGDPAPSQPGTDEGAALESALVALSPLRRWLYRWILEKARRRVRDRENLRFERTRLFGRVRRILRGLGEHLVAMGRLKQRDEVFYAELEEVLGLFDGTAAAPLSPALVAARRAEFEAFRAAPAPPDRFETRGSPWRPGAIPSPAPSEAADRDADLLGIGACAGRVRGPVRVVFDPRGIELALGEILVAQQTDPGWVVLFPAASGLLVERGSLLSHSAIVAREMGIPAVVSLPGLTSALRDGEWVEMDGAAGTVKRIETPD